jgi:hypothetical protein
MTELLPWHRSISFACTGLTPRINDYLQTIGQAMGVDRRTKGYLHDYVRSWIEWLHLGEHCSDITHDNSQTTQDQHSLCVDRDKVEHRFEIEDMVYLTVQPFRPSTWRRGGVEKMRPRLFGPFEVIQRVGGEAYELELTVGSQGRSIYHVSCLQRVRGPQVTTPIKLPPLDERGRMLLTPKENMDVRERRPRSRVIKEDRVTWRDWMVEDATWESEHILQHPGLRLLEDKQSREGRIVMSPPF